MRHRRERSQVGNDMLVIRRSLQDAIASLEPSDEDGAGACRARGSLVDGQHIRGGVRPASATLMVRARLRPADHCRCFRSI